MSIQNLILVLKEIYVFQADPQNDIITKLKTI